MLLGNTPRKEVSFAVEASKSFAFAMQFNYEDGQSFDLTDAELRLVLTEPPQLGGTELLIISAESGAWSSGLAQFNIQAEDLAIDSASYPYDVTLTNSNGYSIPILKGYFEVGLNTDQNIINTYVSTVVPAYITVLMDSYGTAVARVLVGKSDG